MKNSKDRPTPVFKRYFSWLICRLILFCASIWLLVNHPEQLDFTERFGFQSGLSFVNLAFCLMVIVALFCTLAGVFLFSTGVRILGASTASVLNMLEPVVSLAAGTLIYHDPLGLKILAGCMLIVISGMAAVMDRPRKELS